MTIQAFRYFLEFDLDLSKFSKVTVYEQCKFPTTYELMPIEQCALGI
jgi:hypothetical protein